MSNDFRTFLKKIVLFSVCSIVLYVVFLYVSGEVLSKRYKPNLIYKLGHNQLRLREVKEFGNVDVLFLGSSHAYRGFDTRIFNEAGYKSFNLGSSAQTPTQTLLLLKRYLKQLQPKLVILEVFPNTFTVDGIESALDLVANDKNDLLSLKMVLELNNMKVNNTFIYALTKNILKPESILKLNMYQEGGYLSQDTLTYNFDIEPQKSSIILKESHLKNFEIILEMLKNENIDYVLVQAPITSIMYNSYNNIDGFNEKMAIEGQYYNFNSELNLNLNDTLDFYDNHHLNQNGVIKFNAAFLELLKKNHNDVLKKSN